ncbi:MAG: carboxypeptidase-like regulatory domain-containing protein [Candidatus Acidiferrales bacterium]
MNLRSIRVPALSFGLLVLACALPLAAAPNSGKISGVVMDPTGTPQMGATVSISAENLLAFSPTELLTNDRGRFSTATLAPGMYSIKVTLAGFLPAIQQHIQVNDQQTTLLEIVLGSVLSSFEKLRRQPTEQVASDEWIWVLRSSSATRSILRWQDGTIIVEGVPNQAEIAQKQSIHGQLDVTSGSDHPGSVSNFADSPATAFAYDVAVGERGRLYMAGQFSYEGSAPAGGLVAEWVPSGELGDGSVSSIVVRESQLGPNGPTFRGVRISHQNQMALTDRVSLRYGSDYVAAGLGASTMALRPRGEIAIQLSPSWHVAGLVAMSSWQQDSDGLQSAMNSLDAFPTLLMRAGRPVFDDNLHAEIEVGHALSKTSSVSAAVFHDNSSHTAVFGRGPVSGSDFLQDYFSDVFAYDAGRTSSMGARAAFHQKLADNFDTTIVYDYAGVLAPYEDALEGSLRDQLVTRYRHSLAGHVSATLPRSKTKISVGYKWIGGQAVSHLDAYGESLFHLDPYLNMEIRQQLPSFFPGHMEAMADFGNLLAQGYVPVSTGDGHVVLVPSYRYFRGGLSVQF